MEPITVTVTVPTTTSQSFEVFTAHVGEWWPPAYSPDPDTLDTVVIEPRIGGRVFLRMMDGVELGIGEVTAWVPGEVYAQTWTLAQDPEQPSSVTVTFTPTGDGCEVRLQHGGWHENNVAHRDKFGDWPLILGHYAETAQELDTTR